MDSSKLLNAEALALILEDNQQAGAAQQDGKQNPPAQNDAQQQNNQTPTNSGAATESVQGDNGGTAAESDGGATQGTPNGAGAPAQTEEVPQQEGAADTTPEGSADGSLDEIKDFVGKNPDITDWPEEQLNKLIGFLNGLDEFRNSKKAQAAIKAIQQVEKENGSGGGNADNAAGANNAAAGQNNGAAADNQNAASAQGNPSNVPSGDLTTAMTRLTGLVSGAYTAADLEAAIKQKQGK